MLRSTFKKPYVGSIDQGTSSTRFMLFDSEGETVLSHQVTLPQHHPEPGWVEHDPTEIMNSVNECIQNVMNDYYSNGYGEKSDIKAIGVTNQRETTVLWNGATGKPLHNAIVWCDTRTKDLVTQFTQRARSISADYLNELKKKSGLPISTYFSALKMKYLADKTGIREGHNSKDMKMATIDSWIIWNMTKGEAFITDVTNASRTSLMNLVDCKWDDDLCKFFEVDKIWLPEIRSSSEVYGKIAEGPLQGIPIAGDLGDQQSAMVGQMCLQKGMAKNTYGTGCFLLYNTGSDIVYSDNGLLTTVCYQLGKDEKVAYALEGGVAVAGAGVRWFIDNLGIAKSSQEVEDLANQVEDTGGMYFVPAFSGLFAPYWRDDARGVMVGLTHHTNKSHLSRAVLESTCFQTLEVLEAMEKDANHKLSELRVDGGMAKNNLMLQIESDILQIPVVKPKNLETTCFGAAFAAGLAVGVYNKNLTTAISKKFTPILDKESSQKKIKEWRKAVSRSLNWVDS